MGQYLDTLNEVINTFVGNNPVKLMGVSSGGRLAMEYAVLQPESVEQLILSNSDPRSQELSTKGKKNVLAKLPEEVSSFLNNECWFAMGHKCHNTEFAIKCFDGQLLPYWQSKENADKLLLQPLKKLGEIGKFSCDIAKEDQYVTAMSTVSYSPSNDLINVPTIIIHSENDVIILKDAMNHTKNGIKNYHLFYLKNAGHMLIFENSSLLYKIVNTKVSYNQNETTVIDGITGEEISLVEDTTAFASTESQNEL
jgi:pimeloyl-ACP methyl ester carboxylesterase